MKKTGMSMIRFNFKIILIILILHNMSTILSEYYSWNIVCPIKATRMMLQISLEIVNLYSRERTEFFM